MLPFNFYLYMFILVIGIKVLIIFSHPPHMSVSVYVCIYTHICIYVSLHVCVCVCVSSLGGLMLLFRKVLYCSSILLTETMSLYQTRGLHIVSLTISEFLCLNLGGLPYPLDILHGFLES